MNTLRAGMACAWLAMIVCIGTGRAQARKAEGGPVEKDTIATSKGDVTLGLVGHGTLMLQFGGKVIHVDPVAREGDYRTMPKADLILITHEHGDHLDADVIRALCRPDTEVIVAPGCAEALPEAVVMKNGETRDSAAGVPVEAVAAYNLLHKRPSGEPFHPKGRGNGYILTFGNVRVYIAGDTENSPEMKALRDIDVAFLPMNLPYTMTPEMVADAARAFRPKILYPYHYGRTEPEELVKMLADEAGIEVRVRALR